MDEGKVLKQAVKVHGYTDEQFAEKLGVTRQTLSNWYGKSMLSPKSKQLVKKFIKVDFTSKELEENSATISKSELERLWDIINALLCCF